MLSGAKENPLLHFAKQNNFDMASNFQYDYSSMHFLPVKENIYMSPVHVCTDTTFNCLINGSSEETMVFFSSNIDVMFISSLLRAIRMGILR